ncbi:MAG: hypothetical protein ACTSWN_15750 [Promethearchaeota archaeon]
MKLENNSFRNHLICILTRESATLGRKVGCLFGKKGQDSDLVFYSSVHGSHIFTAIVPVGYPDKIKTLMQALAISEYCLFIIKPDEKFDALIGEMILALELKNDIIPLFAIAGITSDNEYLLDETRSKLEKIIQGTSLKERVNEIHILKDDKDDFDRLKNEIVERAREGDDQDANALVFIDSAFPVKGIGTVILGVVKTGMVFSGGFLELVDPVKPSKNVIIKSIQIQDVDHKEARRGDRVGWAIKGVKANEIDRENVLADKGSIQTFDKIKIQFKLCRFAKNNIGVNGKQQYHLAIGMQVFPVKPVSILGTKKEGIIEPNEIGIIEFRSDKKFAVSNTNNQVFVVILEKFNGRLRILGSGNVI